MRPTPSASGKTGNPSETHRRPPGRVYALARGPAKRCEVRVAPDRTVNQAEAHREKTWVRASLFARVTRSDCSRAQAAAQAEADTTRSLATARSKAAFEGELPQQNPSPGAGVKHQPSRMQYPTRKGKDAPLPAPSCHPALLPHWGEGALRAHLAGSDRRKGEPGNLGPRRGPPGGDPGADHFFTLRPSGF